MAGTHEKDLVKKNHVFFAKGEGIILKLGIIHL